MPSGTKMLVAHTVLSHGLLNSRAFLFAWTHPRAGMTDHELHLGTDRGGEQGNPPALAHAVQADVLPATDGCRRRTETAANFAGPILQGLLGPMTR